MSSVFLFRGDGGQSASGAVKGGWRRVSFGVVFCGEWRRVSFRGCEGGRGASQLWSLVVVSSVFLFRGDGGQSASGAVKGGWRRVSFGVVFCGEWRRVSFRGCEGGRGASQLWSLVVVSSVFLVSGGRGPVSFRRGKGGQSALEFGGGVVVFFVSGGRGPVSFRGCEGGRGASQLWSLVVVSSVFLFRGDGGQSASGAVKGEGGPVSFGVWWWCRRFFCFGGTGASQLPGL